MSSKGTSALPNDSNVTFRSETCRNHPSNPLMNNQFRASGLNLTIKENLQTEKRKKEIKEIEQQIIRKLNNLSSTLLGDKETTPNL